MQISIIISLFAAGFAFALPSNIPGPMAASVPVKSDTDYRMHDIAATSMTAGMDVNPYILPPKPDDAEWNLPKPIEYQSIPKASDINPKHPQRPKSIVDHIRNVFTPTDQNQFTRAVIKQDTAKMDALMDRMSYGDVEGHYVHAATRGLDKTVAHLSAYMDETSRAMALNRASIYGHSGAIRAILDHAHDLDHDRLHEAMMLAARNGHLDALKALTTHRAFPFRNILGSYDDAVAVAASRMHHDVMQYLLSHHAAPETIRVQKALENAVRANDHVGAQILLDHGVKINVEGAIGVARKYGHSRMIKRLQGNRNPQSTVEKCITACFSGAL